MNGTGRRERGRIDGTSAGPASSSSNKPTSLKKNMSLMSLSGANKSGEMWRGSTMRGCHFIDTKLVGTDMRDADLRRSSISSSSANLLDMKGAKLSGADLEGSTLYRCEIEPGPQDPDGLGGAKLIDARIIKCKLRRCSFGSAARGTFDPTTVTFLFSHFIECKIDGLVLSMPNKPNLYKSRSQISMPEPHPPTSVKKTISLASSPKSARVHVPQAVEGVIDCFEEVKFTKCSMKGSVFSGASLFNSIFEDSRLTRCDFGDCNMAGVSMERCDVSTCMFSRRTVLDGIHLEDCDLSKAALGGVSVRRGAGALIRRCKLDNTLLCRAILRGFVFDDCEFNMTDFTGTDIVGAMFSKCTFLPGTILNLESLAEEGESKKKKSGAAARKAKFSNKCVLRGVVIRGNLNAVLFEPDTILHNAEFQDVDLRGVRLDSLDLRMASFNGTVKTNRDTAIVNCELTGIMGAERLKGVNGIGMCTGSPPVVLEPTRDHRGMVHYVGTAGNTESYENPALLDPPLVRPFANHPLEKGELHYVTDQQPRRDACFTEPNTEGAFMGIEFSENIGRFAVTHYSITHGSSAPSHQLKSWVFEGSQDGKTWTLLDNRKDDSTLKDTRTGFGIGLFEAREELNMSETWRMVRVRMTGPSHGGVGADWSLKCSGIEVYGILYNKPHFVDLDMTAYQASGGDFRDGIVDNCSLGDISVDNSNLCRVSIRDCKLLSKQKIVLSSCPLYQCTVSSFEMETGSSIKVKRTCILTGSTFKNVWMPEENMVRLEPTTVLANCRFDGCNMKGFQFGSGCVMDGCNFSSAKLVGINWSDLSLNGSNFEGADMTGAELTRCGLSGCRFKLKHSNISFNQCDLSGSRIICRKGSFVRLDPSCILTGALLTGDMKGISMEPGVQLKKVVFDGIDLSGVYWEGLDLRKTTFKENVKTDSDTTLVRCNLTGAKGAERLNGCNGIGLCRGGPPVQIPDDKKGVYGIVHYLGTLARTTDHTNPSLREPPLVIPFLNGEMSEGESTQLTEEIRLKQTRGASYASSCADDPYIGLDFTEKRKVKVTSYVVVDAGAGSADHRLRIWILEGSVDGKEWVPLDIRKDDLTLQLHSGPSKAAIGRFEVDQASAGASKAWRYVRIRRPTPAVDGMQRSWYHVRLTHLELFGTLYNMADDEEKIPSKNKTKSQKRPPEGVAASVVAVPATQHSGKASASETEGLSAEPMRPQELRKNRGKSESGSGEGEEKQKNDPARQGRPDYPKTNEARQKTEKPVESRKVNDGGNESGSKYPNGKERNPEDSRGQQDDKKRQAKAETIPRIPNESKQRLGPAPPGREKTTEDKGVAEETPKSSTEQRKRMQAPQSSSESAGREMTSKPSQDRKKGRQLREGGKQAESVDSKTSNGAGKAGRISGR